MHTIYRASVLAGTVLLLAAQEQTATDPAQFELAKSVPADRATVPSVSEIRLWFSEAPMEMGPGTVSIAVLDEAGARVASGDGVADPNDGKVFSLPLADALGPGQHTVAWSTMAEDGEDVAGRFSFTIAAR